MLGFYYSGVAPVTNSPPITYYPVSFGAAPTLLGEPIVDPKGAIHINGILSAPASPSLARGGLIMDNVFQTTYQRWVCPQVGVYVERSILLNGVNYKDDAHPFIIVWTATFPPGAGQQYPTSVELLGEDFNCSGGGITVSP